VQGSVQRPLLFSIFINDNVAQIDFCWFYMYADDLQLYLSEDSMNVFVVCWTWIDCKSGPLRTVCVWSWEISGHYDKFSWILCGQLLGCATIPFCTRVKSLGLTINSRSAWVDQINIVCRQAYFTLKRLWTTASLNLVGTRWQLARSLVVPLFLYCDVICGGCGVAWQAVTGCNSII
jgi:hypothetical protein